jgi:hypothetical protein
MKPYFQDDAAICERMEGSNSSESSSSLIIPAPWPPAGVEWYYSDKSCAIACGDCREILPLLPKVDLVLTDPPYGIGRLRRRLTFLLCLLLAVTALSGEEIISPYRLVAAGLYGAS